ncbi:protein Bouncer [Anabas testudineus]|uniref:UPAR/Ly6 domain-containing protein n=1 Tax=Anabas testudineus TaxID=64144 RepID=A0AAQ6IPE1_ANATE|nr:protein Bouncer [Anabas testudineus]
MSRIVLQLVAVGLCFAVGQALQCYSCAGVWNLCITASITCQPGEQCYSGIGKAAKFVDIKMKGCLEVAKCNQTQDVNFPTTNNNSVYSMTKTCCNTDLCNTAPGLPGATGLSLAITTIAALFVANLLV